MHGGTPEGNLAQAFLLVAKPFQQGKGSQMIVVLRERHFLFAAQTPDKIEIDEVSKFEALRHARGHDALAMQAMVQHEFRLDCEFTARRNHPRHRSRSATPRISSR